MAINLDKEAKLTPMMQQWKECKEEAKDALLFFRLGDFYEAFHEDASIIAKELELTLTARQEVPMCGIPWHTSEGYIDKLVAKGFRIAIAEQVEDPKKTKGLVKRKVVRVISPGSCLSSGIISEKSSNFIASICLLDNLYGLALLDLSSSDIALFECIDTKELLNELFRSKPKEIVVSKRFKERSQDIVLEITMNLKTVIIPQEDWIFKNEQAQEFLLNHFKVSTLDGFGVKSLSSAISAAGALLEYIAHDLLIPIDHIQSTGCY